MTVFSSNIGLWRWRTGALVALCLGLGSAGPVRAQQVLVASTAPYWQVGDPDPALSRACSLGRFGLRDPRRYVARFTGKEGPGVLGIAKGTGLNLSDPDHHAKPEEDYFFQAHGTSSCKVYVGGRKKSAAGAPGSPPGTPPAKAPGSS